MNSLYIKYYELFKTKFTDEEAKFLVEYIDIKTNNLKERGKDFFITREEKETLAKKEDVKEVEDRYTQRNKEIFATKAEMQEQKSEIIKWMFIFWDYSDDNIICFYALFY